MRQLSMLVLTRLAVRRLFQQSYFELERGKLHGTGLYTRRVGHVHAERVHDYVKVQRTRILIFRNLN